MRTDSSPPHQGLAQATNGNAAAVESLDPEAGSAMEKFLPIIKSRNISLEDRIGFACTYLSDTEVVEYLSALVTDCQATGDYEGLLITGNAYMYKHIYIYIYVYMYR